jgi:hypothetical protein
MNDKIYKDKLEDKNYSGSGVYVKDVSVHGAGVTSLNGKEGELSIAINSSSEDETLVNLGIDATNIPLATPESHSRSAEIPSVATAVNSLGAAVSDLANNKKSIDKVKVGAEESTIEANSVSISLPSNSGLTGSVTNTSSVSTIALSTDDSVAKKFVVSDGNVVADASNPYKFVSSDNSVTISKGNNDGEIDFSVDSSSSGVSSLNEDTGDLTIGINDGNKDVNLTVDATQIPKSSTDTDTVSSCLDNKNSLDELQVAGSGNYDITKNVLILSISESKGLTAKYTETGVKGTIELNTTDSVPKKFVVGSDNIVADNTHPYKIVSSDSSVTISKTNIAGEIDFKIAGGSSNTKEMKRTLLEYVSESTEYNGVKSFFESGAFFNFIIKTRKSPLPQTSDTYLDFYYLDYIKEKDLNMGPLSIYRTTDSPDETTQFLKIYAKRQDSSNYSLVVSVKDIRTGVITLYEATPNNPAISLNLSAFLHKDNSDGSSTDYRIVKAFFETVEGYAKWDFESFLTIAPFIFIRYNLIATPVVV